MIKKNIILTLLSIFVFSGVFSLRYLTQLDSVYFYPEAYSDLISKINIWGSYDAPFGGVHMILWLYPITYLAGLLGNLFNFDWNILVRLFFYLPSIFLSIYSIQKLAGSFKFGDRGKFLMSLIYLFNTYFILLIDGGQLGVMLAYAIFPLAVESILNLNFFRTTTILAVLAMFDPRFFLIAILTGFLLDKIKLIKLIKFLPIFTVVLLISSYWLLPILKIGGTSVATFVSELKLTSFLNPLFLYQPHWPNNVFGKTTYPNILFITIPLLLILSSFIKSTKEKSYWLLIFIFFAFLVKGETDPFGFIYSYFVNNFSFATVFRDSTKFFTPLIVLYALIVSRYYDDTMSTDKKKNKYLDWIIPIAILIPLVPGLITGGNNNLKGISEVNHFLNLKQELKSEDFSRTVYIPQKPQLAYQTENNQAIDGRVLANYLPFAADNYGSGDRFNFMLRDNYVNYFRSLGIRNIVTTTKGIPNVTKIEDSMPEKYYIDKMAVVVGSPIGVSELIPEYGAIFIEDGKNNLLDLLKTSNDNLFFILNDKTTLDLIMSGLKDNFIDPSTIKNSGWGKYTADDYLTWKYQLLIREIETKDINYNSGVILSTVKDETAKINLNLDSSLKYKVFIRAMAGKDSEGVYLNDVLYTTPTGNVFKWIEGDLTSSHNDEIIIKNNGGFNVIGSILVIETDKFNEYKNRINEDLKKFEVLNLESKLPVSKVSFEEKTGWLIFNQSYHKSWRFDDKSSFAVNSITNGFPVENKDFDRGIYFEDQKILDLSARISLASVLLLVVSYLGYATYVFVQKRKKYH